MVDILSNMSSAGENNSLSPQAKKSLSSIRTPKSISSPTKTDIEKREKLHQQIEQLSAVVTKKGDGFESDMQNIVAAKKVSAFAGKVCKLVDDLEKYGATEEDQNLLKASLAIIDKALHKIRGTSLSDEAGRTRLHTLCGQEFGLVPPQHLKEAEDFIRGNTDKIIMLRDVEGFTALDHACLAGNPEFLKLFCDMGKASLFVKKDKDGDMPLHILCAGMTGENITPRHIEVAKILIENMTEEQLNAKNKAGETALALIMKPLKEVIMALEKASSDYDKAAAVPPKTSDEKDRRAYEKELSVLAAVRSDYVGQMTSLRGIADLIENAKK